MPDDRFIRDGRTLREWAARRVLPSLADDLWGILKQSEEDGNVLRVLAALARERRDVFERVVEQARPSPPDIRAHEGYPQYTYDAAMYRRGAALEMLGTSAPSRPKPLRSSSTRWTRSRSTTPTGGTRTASMGGWSPH